MTPASLIGASAADLVIMLLLQLPADAPGKATDDVLGAWAWVLDVRETLLAGACDAGEDEAKVGR